MNGQKVIGIVGGGQLGRMLTLAALPLGFRVIVIDPTPNCPAAQVGATEITAHLYDEGALRQLADKSDYITVEIEHLDTTVLEALAAAGAQINPAPSTIRLIQDKLLQKQFLQKAGLPIAPFIEITDSASAHAALKEYGGSMLIKTRHGAYDGRGNMLVQNEADIITALDTFAGRPLYAEALVPFVKELAVMVARSTNGDIATYPIVETLQERNICVEVLVPAPISVAEREAAEHVALLVAGLLDGAGTFGIELFLTADGTIFVNEIAPRVHNSGHYTTEATRTSQFEQHIRAITGLPLGDTSLVVPAAVMVNILGERDGPTQLEGLNEVLAIPQTSVHLYGKAPTKIDRKMGHITATGKDVAQAQDRARRARKALRI